MKRFASIALSFLCVLSAAPLSADAPPHYEQLVYSVTAFNGRDYSGTFVRQSSDAVFLFANVDNFLTPRKTFVYFWPLTGEYRLDTDSLDVPLAGRLRVRGARTQLLLHEHAYTFYSRRGQYELNWSVVKDADAARMYAAYRDSVDRYMEEQANFERARSEYERALSDLAAEAAVTRDGGGDLTILNKRARALVEPQPPAPPSDYVAPPSEPQNGFVVNLPAGSYHISLKLPDGTTAEGSEKRLVVVEPRRTGNTGYDVIPGDKWTRPERSVTPGAVTYVNGTTDLYLRPYYEAAVEDLAYKRLLNNDGRGNRNLSTWISLQQIPGARIVIDSDRQRSSVVEAPFKVDQLSGSALGYTIRTWTPTGTGDSPDLIAYHIPIDRSERVVRLRAYDRTGSPLVGSSREIRVLDPSRPEVLLILLAAFPLAVFGVIAAIRKRQCAE